MVKIGQLVSEYCHNNARNWKLLTVNELNNQRLQITLYQKYLTEYCYNNIIFTCHGFVLRSTYVHVFVMLTCVCLCPYVNVLLSTCVYVLMSSCVVYVLMSTCACFCPYVNKCIFLSLCQVLLFLPLCQLVLFSSFCKHMHVLPWSKNRK